MYPAELMFIDNLETKLAREELGDVVWLAGGGQDSAAAMLAWMHHAHDAMYGAKEDTTQIIIHPMYFDYGQLTSEPELLCVQEQITALEDEWNSVIGVEKIIKMGDPMMEYLKASGHYMATGKEGDGAYHAVELRNLRYLAIAAAYAANVKAKWIVFGGSPVSLVDNGYAATLATQRALMENVMDPTLTVRIYAPLVMVHRSRVVRYLHDNNVQNFEKANFSCYSPVRQGEDAGIYVPCGKCKSCEWRAVGHRLAGIPDPREFVRVPVQTATPIKKKASRK